MCVSHEHVSGEDGQDFLRPVVHLPKRIFTRIDPKRNETSMVIRIRDGWDSLSAYLRGEGTGEKRQRFKIWVCTAAERGYALEAWRLLDPNGELIPKEDVKKRLICAGKQKKSLFRTFNLGPLHEEPVPKKALCPRKKLCPLCEGHSELAMAIIADDRTDVWEKRNQDQIIHISPFQYPCVEDKDPNEIQRMLTSFQSVRSQFYFELLEKMAPAVRDAMSVGIETEKWTQCLKESMAKAASISHFLTTVVTPPAVSAPPEPPAMKEASLKPNDRRTLVEHRLSRMPNPNAQRVSLLPKKRKNTGVSKRSIPNTSLLPKVEDRNLAKIEEQPASMTPLPFIETQKTVEPSTRETKDAGRDPHLSHSVCERFCR